MKKFEYKIVKSSLSEDELNILGDEGWELICHNIVVSNQMFIFKKEI